MQLRNIHFALVRMVFITAIYIFLSSPAQTVAWSLSLTLDDDDRKAITTVIADYTKAWNRHDMKSFSNAFDLDADFVNVFGQKFSGKLEIEERHVKIHQTFVKDSHMSLTQLSLKPIRPDVVIAHVRWKVTGFRTPHTEEGHLGETRHGIFTQVFTKNNDIWSITASQNTFQSPSL